MLLQLGPLTRKMADVENGRDSGANDRSHRVLQQGSYFELNIRKETGSTPPCSSEMKQCKEIASYAGL